MELDKDLPFETLLQLEQKLGSKTFREAQAASSNKGETRMLPKKRKGDSKVDDNSGDEAPEEMSSKNPPKRSLIKAARTRQAPSIDPRFNPKAGKFKEDHFRKNFQFAFDMKDKELEELKKSTKLIKDPEQTEKAKYLIQRMENQKREQQRKKAKSKSVIVNKDGTKYFPSKKEVFAQEMVEKYVELKESGKLGSHLEKRRKKQAGKERKRMQIEKT